MKIHASGEDYLEAVLILQKEAGHGAFRGCCSVRGGFKAQRVPCGGNPAGRGGS